jgi:hypothetical protein
MKGGSLEGKMQEHLIGIGHNGPPRDIASPQWLNGVEARICWRVHRTVHVKSARRRHESSELPDVSPNAVGDILRLESARTSYSRCTLPMAHDLEKALVSPASVFRTPEDVVRDPLLSHYCKREILWRWAWDEYLVEIAQGEGMIGESASHLDEVKTALLQLGDEWHPHPSAPAAFPTRLEEAETALAA